MPQLINTNIAALNVQRNLGNSQSAGMQAMERLASGLRINSANDDAAGLAISTRFTSQINGAEVAVRNAGEGIALSQTAEGALSAIHENLLRIRDLAVQASNATNSDVDRQALQAEVEQLVAEISLTAEQTAFNGRNLLDGSFSDVFQMGANAGQTIDLSIDKLTVDRLGASAQAGLSARGTDAALGTADLVINGVAIGASRSADDSASTSNQAASAIAKSAAINRHSSETGVSAAPDTNVAAGSKMEGMNGSGHFTLNGVDIAFATTADTAATRAAVAQAINFVADLTGVSAFDTESDATGINLIAEDGRNIQLSFDMLEINPLDEKSFASATGLAGASINHFGTTYSSTYEGGYTLLAGNGTNEIEISGGNGTGRGDLANAGLPAGNFEAGRSVNFSDALASSIQPAVISGGSLNNAISRTDSGASFIGKDSGTRVNLAGTTIADTRIFWDLDAVVRVGENEFQATGNDGAINHYSRFANLFLDGEAAAAGLGSSVNFFEQIDFEIQAVTTPVGGSSITLAGVAIQLEDSNSAGYSLDLQLTSIMEQINSQDFSAVLGAEGSVVAEINADRNSLSIRIRNESFDPVRLELDASTSVQASLGGAGGDLMMSNANYYVVGNLAYEALTDETVEVVVVAAHGSHNQLFGAEGADVTRSSSTETLTTTEPVQLSVFNPDEQTQILPGGASVASLSATLSEMDGVEAWESIQLEFASSNLKPGDRLSIAGVEFPVEGDESGVVTLATLVDSLNKTDFSDVSLEVAAQLSPDANSASLTIKNYTGNTVTMESVGSEGRGISFIDPVAFVGEQSQSLSGEVHFISTNGNAVDVTLSEPAGAGELFVGGVVSASYQGVDGLDNGDLVINGVNIGSARSSADTASATSASDGSPIISSDKTRSAIAMADAINQQSSKTGVSAEVNPTLVVGGDGSSLDPESLNQFEAGDEAGIFINGISIGTVKLQQDSSGDLDTDRARADALTLINQASGKTGVTAVDNGVSLTLSAADGRNLSVAIDDRSGSSASIGALIGLDAAVDGIGESTFGAATAGSPVSSEGLTYETTYGTISLISASPFEIRAGNQGSENLANLGFSTGTFGGQGQGQFLQDLDISSFEGAQLAIVATDNAIEKIANQRAELGAVQNRLEASVSRLHIVSENLSSANSRILDADFAAETAEMSRTQVLQQAGMSVLAQANASSQQVLSLLG